MNGSENGYSGALFFALMSFGSFFKLDDFIGSAVGVLCAILAALCLRIALIKSAQAVEEDHQRMEIQFQQLRNKVSESSAVNVEAMNSITDAAQLVQENLQVIRVRLAELDNLTQLAENSSEINSELEKLNALEDSNKANLQTILKLLQLVAQLIKNQSYSRDLEKINLTLENLAANKKNAPIRRD